MLVEREATEENKRKVTNKERVKGTNRKDGYKP